MTEKKSPTPQKPVKPAAAQRQRRLAQAVRDNLRRRKQQQTAADTAGKSDAAGPSGRPDREKGE